MASASEPPQMVATRTRGLSRAWRIRAGSGVSVMLLDIIIAGMSGYRVLQQLRA